ncbi:MAG: Rieske 2Fe-2S domain-containing protein [Thermomicrobiales bacterium]
MTKHIVGTIDEIPAGGRKIVEIAGRSLGVFNINGEYFALRNRCPHQGGLLCVGQALTGFITSSSTPGEYEYSRKGGDHRPLPSARLGNSTSAPANPGSILRQSPRPPLRSQSRTRHRPRRTRRPRARPRTRPLHRRDSTPSPSSSTTVVDLPGN